MPGGTCTGCIEPITAHAKLAALVRVAGLHALAMAHLDSRLVIRRNSAHTLLDLTSHSSESLFNIGRVLCRCFQKWDTKAISKFLFRKKVSIG